MNDSGSYPGMELLQGFSTVDEIKHNIFIHCPVTKARIKKEGIYVFGIGKLGQRIFDFLLGYKIKIHAFVDNNKSKHGTLFNSTKVVPADEIPKNSIVYIASATYYNVILNQLKNLGVKDCISHNQASILFNGDIHFPVEMYQENLVSDLIDYKQKYSEVFNLLEEEESRRVFDNLIQYRLTLDHKYINNIHTSLAKEYFDNEVITLSNHETFFDLGGFDGDSAEHFIRHVDYHYESIHIFEPDAALIQKAKKRFEQNENIFFNELGIYDSNTTLYFDKTGGLDGIISENGNLKITTTTLDSYGKKPTYIKFDVEGVEIKAINGGKETLKSLKPKLAIASYHYPKHLWEIPLFVKKINPDYKIYLRHYTDSIFDSIYYFT